MVILGLLLLAAAGVAGTELAINNSTGVEYVFFGHVYTIPVYSVFLLGALVMAVGTLGAFLITGAFQRRRAVRRDAKHAVRTEDTQTRLGTVEQTNAELVAENDRLRAELADHQRAAATLGGVAVPPGVGDVAYGDQVSDAVRSETISDTGRFDPYPTEGGTRTGAAVNTEDRSVLDGGRFGRTDGVDTTASEVKADVVGRYRGTT
jgi:uncharacterized integral membrane protein